MIVVVVEVSVRAWSSLSRSNSPGGLSSVDPAEAVQLVASGGDVRELQRKLWVAAKRSPGRRFHALYDRIWRGDVLQEAWTRVRRNKGAAGVDAATLAAVRGVRGGADVSVSCSVIFALGAIARGRFGGWRSPSPHGGRRPLGIPTVSDRIVQQAARIVLEPIFEADFLEVSFGFRPRRSATDAKEVLRRSFIDGYQFVFEADIRNYFGRDRS